MWLLNTRTLELTYFVGECPEYAILSHRWEEEELLFQDLTKNPLAIRIAQRDPNVGLPRYKGLALWPPKINSSGYGLIAAVSTSRALQNYKKPSTPCSNGSKCLRHEQLSQITGIAPSAVAPHALRGDAFSDVCAAAKMPWAAHREVSRAEDEAYCLLGLCNISLPLLYGERGINAFRRLQQAIYEREADSTLFLFTLGIGEHFTSLFADTAKQFCNALECQTHDRFWVYFPCFPRHILYSELPPATRWRDTSEDDHFVRLVRQGVMVKLSTITYDPALRELELIRDTPHDATNSLGPYTKNISHDDCLALLPWIYPGDKMQVLGIGLQQSYDGNFLRDRSAPVLISQAWVAEHKSVTKTLLVRDNSIRYPGNRQLGLRLDFSSSTCEVVSWKLPWKSSSALNDQATFYIPHYTISHWGDDLVTLRVSTSRLPGVAVVCVLRGNHHNESEAQLQNAEIVRQSWSSDTLEPPLEPPQVLLTDPKCYDRLTIVLPSSGARIHVALRRLAILTADHRQEVFGSQRYHEVVVSTRYRVDVEYAENTSSPLER
ncbi:hypothetical protein BDW02DRAFT_583967 [Decorospora gaudefroyi]|uniref:Heterokaryon incompatibility domain-containing protein n=1 Tax=Decorospora gaudefroyi TaxID=184978 RepID=A0A6A5JY75_9PLEO|nr:hypothetical protein BDW02DRAFT_583967 [Decorospora gaudefroyi]